MERWTFGDFVLDLDAHELLRAGTPVSFSPKAFQLLGILVENHPRALSKTELQDRLWPGTFVVEKNLTNLVSEIREALGDDPLIHVLFGRSMVSATPSARCQRSVSRGDSVTPVARPPQCELTREAPAQSSGTADELHRARSRNR